MTIINSFLQKKMLREFNHGTYMVIAAYTLSFLLLVIGSDTLYNNKTKVNGMSIRSDEVNQATTAEDFSSVNNTFDGSQGMDSSYQVEYRIDYIQKCINSYQEAVISEAEGSDDTNWLLGHSMNDEEYSRLMHHISKNEVFTKDSDKEGVISSFSITEQTDKTNMSITDEEIKMLERIVEAEATGEDIIGKILIANVVFNRMADEEFPDNVKDVIFQKEGGAYQFSPIADKRYWKVEITDETREAVQRALKGEDYSEGALYFMARRMARKKSIRWFDNNLQWLFKHGDHEFYK